MTTLTPEVRLPTLADAAAEAALFGKVAGKLRELEVAGDVRSVVASEPYGVIVVIDNDYEHVALKVVAA